MFSFKCIFGLRSTLDYTSVLSVITLSFLLAGYLFGLLFDPEENGSTFL
jgi:hypothetical protein